MLSPKIDIEIDAACACSSPVVSKNRLANTVDQNPVRGCVVHDKIRDKMYVDIRQTFSLWFIPMYHAHVRLVTVLDLVASDDADFHDPLDRIIKQEREGGEKSTAQLLHHHQHHHNGDRPRRYRIQRQEDLYQVNDFLKFLGGPGPLPFLWFLFQLQATAICVLMSLFVRLSPWAFQPEPARGGVEAIIERVDSYHDLTSEQTEEESPRFRDERNLKHQKVEEEQPIARGIENHGENKNGGESRGVPESSSAVDATNGHNGQRPSNPEHDNKNGVNNNGGDARRESANSKASPTQPRKKSGKKGGNR